jgi:PAS domain S-box-containing protein
MARRGTSSRQPSRRYESGAVASPRRSSALDGLVRDGDGVLLVGLEALRDEAWWVLAASGLELLRAPDTTAAVEVIADGAAQVVLSDVDHAAELIDAVCERPELAAVHVVVCADLDSPRDLRRALDSGADDVMRIPFEPQVLAVRVATGLRAARLRASEALLRSLVDNIPGAVYRCACDLDWTMEWLSDEIEEISGYPASDFIGSAVRTFASVEHPDDHEYVARCVMESVDTGRPFAMEYRIVRRDGTVRWVLERGQAQESGDGRWWLDGAIFDITARREAEQALREREVIKAQLAEVQASRARILDAADRARRDIERNLHDGAQQRLVSVALSMNIWLAQHRDLPEACRDPVRAALEELHTGLAELRDLARGLHPAVLSDHGLEHALRALAQRAGVPVELEIEIPEERLPVAIEAAAYFAVSEALTNVARYAEATEARVRVAREDGHLDVTVRDDGVGGATLGAGSGLEGLRDRLAALDGTLAIESAPGDGTRLHARLPLDAVPALSAPPRS